MATESDLRKRKRYLGLILPNLVMLALLIGYPIFWVAARGALMARLDRMAADLSRAGYSVTREGERVGGFPFRLDVSFKRLRVSAPSGWGVDAKDIEAQAYLHARGHWVLVAKDGFTLLRGPAGRVDVQGQALRASLAGMTKTPWRIVLEGEDVRFQPETGAQPFPLTHVDRIDVLMRPAPDHSGGQIMARISRGAISDGSALKPLVGAAPLDLDLALRITRPEQYQGPSWPLATKAWAKAGGQAQLVRLEAKAGAASLVADSGKVSADADGRFVGSASLRLSLPMTTALLPMRLAGPEALTLRIAAFAAALARGAGGALPLRLSFSEGGMALNDVRIGPAPRFYAPAKSHALISARRPGP